MLMFTHNSITNRLRRLAKYCGLAISIALTSQLSVGCSDNEEAPSTDPADYTLSVSMSYLLEGDETKLDDVEIYTVGEDEDPQLVKQAVNTTWTHHMELPGLPEVFGFMASPAIRDNLGDGTTVDSRVSVKMIIDLKYQGRTIDTKIIDETSETGALDPSKVEWADLVDSYMFHVVDGKIVRVQYTNADDEDETPTEELPSADQDKVKVQGTMYYISDADVAETPDCLHDNIVARFAVRNRWNGNTLGKGDFLYATADEIEGMRDDRHLASSLDNGCILILHEVTSETALRKICDNLGIFCPMADKIDDIASSLFILADSDKPFTDARGTSYRGLFIKLSPLGDNGEAISDYSQGEMADRAAECINGMLSSAPSPAPMARSLSGRAEPENLTAVVNAYKVYISDYKHTLVQSDYRSKSYSKPSQTNVYNVEFDIWNVYSVAEKRNYYYIHQSFLGSFKNCYKGVHKTNIKTDGCYTIAKVGEYYCDHMTLSVKPDASSSGMIIHRNSPSTTLTDVNYTSGFSWNLSGEVSYDGKWGGSVSGGIALSFSDSYTRADMTIENNCVPGSELSWTFSLMKARAKFHPFYGAGSNFIESSLTSRTSMNAYMDYVISFPENVKEPKLNATLGVTLRSSAAKCGSICGERTKEAKTTKEIKLPVHTK